MNTLLELRRLAEDLAADAKSSGYNTIIINAEYNSTKAQLTLSDFEELKNILIELVPDVTVEYQTTN